MYKLSKQFGSLSACKPAGVQKSLETQIYEELLELMELAGKIAEIRDSGEQSAHDIDSQNSAYLYVMNLDRQLQTWYRRLPENLVWKPANIQTAPFSFFLLHQQYHCSLILLHRPWARYEDPSSPPTSEDGHDDGAADDNHSFMSRSICTRQAIRVARIFWHHRQRFDTRRIFVTGIQHAGTAATALVAALAFIKNVNDRKNNMQYLECLASSLGDMGATYQPAASMSSILQAVMIELQNVPKTPPPDFFQSRYLRSEGMASTIPARRESNAEEEDEFRTFKKRQLSKSFTRPPTLSSSSNATTNFPTPNSAMSTTLGNGMFSNDNEGIKHQDGYVMITPRSERAAWPNLNSDLNALDYPMGFGLNAGNMWLDNVSLGGGNAAFGGGDGTDLRDLEAGIGEGGDSHDQGGDGKNQELDFFQF